jgi:hypothetical protein
MLSSLLPGLRDLRTPLTAGYVWLLGLWLLLSDLTPVRQLAARLTSEVHPVVAFAGQGAVLAGVSLAAYLIGSLATRDGVSAVGLLARAAAAYGLDALPRRVGQRLQRDDWERNRARIEAICGAALEDSPQDLEIEIERGTLLTRARLRPRSNPLLNNNDWDRLRMMLASVKNPLLVAESGEFFDTLRDLREAVRWSALDELAEKGFDPSALGVRLHMANKELWDEYDRLKSEGEFRLSIAPPLAVLAVAVGIHGAVWAGALGLVVAGLLNRGGRTKARATNGVLVQFLQTDGVKDPQLEDTRAKWISFCEQEEFRAARLLEAAGRTIRARTPGPAAPPAQPPGQLTAAVG